MLPNATQSGSKFELYGNDGQNYGLKLFASNDASGGFIDWLNRHDRPLTIQTSGICVGSSDCAKIILSGTSKSISFNGGELKSIGIPTASDSAQISNYLGLLGSLVTGICNDGQILQYQSSNSTWICSTSSNNNPAPKISINGNNRSSFTGIIANQTFPAPKIVINSFNSSSFIFGGGVGISISNSSSTHTIKNIGVISATGTSGNLTVNLNTGNVTFNTGNNLAYLAKFNNFTNNNKISTNSKLFIGDGLGNAAGPFLQSPTASPQTLLFGPTSSTSNMVLSGNGLRLGNNTGGSQINPSGANLFLVNPDSRSGILRMEGQGSAGVYQFYEYNGNFVTKMSTLNGDYLGASQGFGFASGTGFNTYRSAWDFRASQDWNTTAQGTYIDFWTTPFNTIVPSEKLRIKDSGDIGFLSGAKLFLDGVAGTGNSYLSRTGSTTTVLDNNGHISTFPATTGTLCQTNQTGSCGTSPSGDIVQAGNIGKGTGSFGPFSSITGSNKLNFKNATAGIGIAESGNTTDITFKNIGVISLTGISGNITTTGGAITGNLTVNTGNNLGYLAKNQLWTGTNTYNGILDLMNTGTFKIGSGKTLIRNPAGTFAYNFLSSAILANETLTLPLTRQTETLAVVPQTAQNTNTTVQTTASASLIFTGKPLSITPQVTGNVRVHFTGYASSGTLLDGCTIQMQEGTGTAPKAGNPSSGTTVGVSIIATSATANANTPFTIIYPITGLTKGTTVWFEPVFSNAIGGTCSMRNTMLVLTEY